MSKNNDGGGAFPRGPYQAGMSLRDWFAGMALSNPALITSEDPYPQTAAYCLADAMLAAREKSNVR